MNFIFEDNILAVFYNKQDIKSIAKIYIISKEFYNWLFF